MEAMLDEERREVLALLEGRAASQRPPSIASPRSPVRSMLDFGGNSSRSPARSSSISGHSRSPPPPRAPIRSMLDVEAPPPVPVRSMLDLDPLPAPSPTLPALAPSTSPTESNYSTHVASHRGHHRAASDASSNPPAFSPRLSTASIDPTSDYQFSDIITSHQGPVLPKRVLRGGKLGSGSMAEVMRGGDVNTLTIPGPKGRHYSVAGVQASRGSQKSKSPHARLGVRSKSPRVSLSGRNMSPAGQAMLNDGQMLDFQNAYRRLSDANLLRSGGSLSTLGRNKKSEDAAGGRLQKDYLSPDGDILPEESSDEHHSSSEDEEENERGRKAARSFPDEDASFLAPPAEADKDGRQTLSLLAAAEEESKFCSQTRFLMVD
jgi:hypothetical protein